MSNTKINIEAIKKRIKKIIREKTVLTIVAHGDWDGVVGAGLLKRWIKDELKLDATVIFPFKDLPKTHLESVITVETSNFALTTSNSIIIDHHIQRKKYDESNVLIIDNKNYDKSSVATLIADKFDIQFEKSFIKAIEEIDNGEINLAKFIFDKIPPENINSKADIFQILKNATETIKLYAAFRADSQSFPKDKIVDWIFERDLKSIYEWATKKCYDFGEVILKVVKILKYNTIKFPNVNAIIITGKDFNIDPIEAQAMRPAALYLEENYKVVIILYINNNNQVISGSIGTFDKFINFESDGYYKAIQALPNIRSVGGRANIGGFQFQEDKLVRQDLIIKELKKILEEYSKKKNIYV